MSCPDWTLPPEDGWMVQKGGGQPLTLALSFGGFIEPNEFACISASILRLM